MNSASADASRRRATATAIPVTVIGALAWLTTWTATRSEPAGLVWLDPAGAVAAMAVTAWTIRQPVAGGIVAGLLAAVPPWAPRRRAPPHYTARGCARSGTFDQRLLRLREARSHCRDS